VDFTREPIIETVITPKEGCKLVVRSSKSNGQEEHFVDAVEVVSFGHSFFFRSLERPKTFLVPATDYEILEVREARMVLKNVGIDRTIKIAGGREAPMRPQREQQPERQHIAAEESSHEGSEEESMAQPAAERQQEGRQDARMDKKRDRRRNYRRRGRGRDGAPGDEEGQESESFAGKGEQGEQREPREQRKTGDGENTPLAQQVMTTSILTSLLPPPPTLISETIAHYKDKFKEAFYPKNDDKSREEQEELTPPTVPLGQPEYGTFELSEEEEEEIYRQRKLHTDKNGEQDGIHGSEGESRAPEALHKDENPE